MGAWKRGVPWCWDPVHAALSYVKYLFFFNAFQSGSWAWQLQEQKHSVQAVPQQVEFPFQLLTRVQ